MANSIGRKTAAAVALAAVAAAAWTLVHLDGKPGASPAPPVAATVEPPAPAVTVKPKRTARVVIARKPVVPVEPAKVRGAALREKGEALGGTTPDRVDKDAATAH